MTVGYRMKRNGKWVTKNNELSDDERDGYIVFENELLKYDYEEKIIYINKNKMYRLKWIEDDLWFADRNPDNHFGRTILKFDDINKASVFSGKSNSKLIIHYCQRFDLYPVEVAEN